MLGVEGGESHKISQVTESLIGCCPTKMNRKAASPLDRYSLRLKPIQHVAIQRIAKGQVVKQGHMTSSFPGLS